MTETLVPVDVEPAICGELNTRMPGHDFAEATADVKIPSPRTPEFIRVLSVGGPPRDLVTDSHTVTVEFFAKTETRAQRGCAYAVAALQAAGRDGLIGDATCYRVRVLSLPQNLPMPSVPDRARYSATLSVDLRRTTE